MICICIYLISCICLMQDIFSCKGASKNRASSEKSKHQDTIILEDQSLIKSNNVPFGGDAVAFTQFLIWTTVYWHPGGGLFGPLLGSTEHHPRKNCRLHAASSSQLRPYCNFFCSGCVFGGLGFSYWGWVALLSYWWIDRMNQDSFELNDCIFEWFAPPSSLIRREVQLCRKTRTTRWVGTERGVAIVVAQVTGFPMGVGSVRALMETKPHHRWVGHTYPQDSMGDPVRSPTFSLWPPL